jgi:hypothetical protein
MGMTHCPHCGARLEEPVVQRPAGCVCDANEWNDPFNLPPVCDSFNGDDIGQNCIKCEHDYECHSHSKESITPPA